MRAVGSAGHEGGDRAKVAAHWESEGPPLYPQAARSKLANALKGLRGASAAPGGSPGSSV